jgi:(4S)-4-hydroxy-5-phosphonooxypentane-2,3-dione isomerase
MSKFATIGTIEVAPGRRDQLLTLLAAHKARCLKDEPGTVQFEILLPMDDDTKVLLYEVYRDDAAFEVHRNGSSFTRWREETAGMVVKLYGTRCAVLRLVGSLTHSYWGRLRHG